MLLIPIQHTTFSLYLSIKAQLLSISVLQINPTLSLALFRSIKSFFHFINQSNSLFTVMDVNGRIFNSVTQSEKEMDLRRGPWTIEEDLLLINYISNHGEGRWNSLARCAGLRRTGKSCRLRWLNYLRPDVRRGNITPEEQLLILELHSRWGNRWSKIAEQLPGRTDNEIKNYWRTRVQKHAKQLKCDVNSKQFKDTMRYLWMPRLVERIRACATTTTATRRADITAAQILDKGSCCNGLGVAQVNPNLTTPENSSTAGSADSLGTQISAGTSDPTHYYNFQATAMDQTGQVTDQLQSLTSPSGYYNHGLEFPAIEQNNMWLFDGDVSENLWNVEDIWFFQQQL